MSHFDKKFWFDITSLSFEDSPSYNDNDYIIPMKVDSKFQKIYDKETKKYKVINKVPDIYPTYKEMEDFTDEEFKKYGGGNCADWTNHLYQSYQQYERKAYHFFYKFLRELTPKEYRGSGKAYKNWGQGHDVIVFENYNVVDPSCQYCAKFKNTTEIFEFYMAYAFYGLKQFYNLAKTKAIKVNWHIFVPNNKHENNWKSAENIWKTTPNLFKIRKFN